MMVEKVAVADKSEHEVKNNQENTRMLDWSWLPFQDLSASQTYDMLALRQQVFVVEQKCVFQDADGIDQQCWHGLGYLPNAGLVAYARIAPPGVVYAEASIGRVVTASTLRGMNAGHALMNQAMAQVAKLFPGHAIKIGAQAHLQRFYGRYGFEPIGEVYDEDGIPHIQMITTSMPNSSTFMHDETIAKIRKS
ncbi:GNAT family N-acetyltransferase [Glaciimonas sp. Gout2]|uniref:GNAT family N-acetyltransferase n=1 Tax=unclassified Glaciimonas TaxID=2644401 RepID=UPI002B223EEC|nr:MULTISPECIES: GNAT family N-acetyltransferase [unclassified Glaciimonas]MEB0013565.1 GNAT family N-acetyltransferase [Glaciimonas sp. Cout2]MEB0083234.1 GNAT family N-acetyltransferase [Glaciimonas sp. Gout2]